MKDIEETIKWTMAYCQHYEPMRGNVSACKAGIVYKEAFGKEPGIYNRMPCTSGNERTKERQLKTCSKWLQKTREQGEAGYHETQEAMNKMRLVGPTVSEWRKKLPHGKQEVIECPACKGRLHLSQASYNGHVHGHCETKDCVSWME